MAQGSRSIVVLWQDMWRKRCVCDHAAPQRMCTSVCWKDCSAVASAAAAVVSVAVCRLETKGKVGTFLAARKGMCKGI